MAKPIQRLNPETLPDAGAAGYSQISIMEPGRLAFISGQVAWTPKGESAPDSLVEQAKLVAGNAKAALDAVEASPADIVMVRLYMVDLTPDRIEQVMPHIIDMFDGVKPSLTGVGVAALAGPDLKLEMEMIVRLPS